MSPHVYIYLLFNIPKIPQLVNNNAIIKVIERIEFMKPHLICLDLDGTLLTDDKTIGNYTKRVIQKLKEEGHYVMISTGRPYRATVPYYKELKLNTPVVNFNGAFVHHPLDFDFKVLHKTLPQAVIKDIVEHIDKYDIKNIVAEVRDDIYFQYHDSVLMSEFFMGDPKIVTGDLRKSMSEEATTVLINTTESRIDYIRRAFDDVYAETVTHRRWGPNVAIIEIIKKGISKATGIEYVLDNLGLDKEYTIAFGDEDNDLQMLQYVTHGVALNNAIDDLKSVADDVTKYDNNNDGVGKYLIDYFNLNVNEGE